MASGVLSVTLTVEVRYYTDPACSWSWGSEPELRRLIWEFDAELRFRWVMGGLARHYGDEYRDEGSGIGAGPDCFADLTAHWLEVAAETGMPFDPRIWSQSPITSTYPACMAVKAASEQGDEAGGRYLRRLREGLMLERRKLDHTEPLVAVAGEAGLDVGRFRLDLGSNAITEAFATDLEEVREIPAEARAAGRVERTEGHERVPFPSLLFIGPGGVRSGVWGRQPYAAYRQAALAVGARPAQDSAGPDAEAVIRRFGRVGTREVELLTGQPHPVVCAELWSAVRDWRLRATRVLTGTLWELA